MLKIMILILFASSFSLAQVDQSEKEKIEQQRESNRQQDALRDSAVRANEKPTESKQFHLEDSGSSFEVDHSALSYSTIFDNNNVSQGVKFSGAFAVAFYNEQKEDKKVRLLCGVELPVDFEMPYRKLVPFAGGGLQFGSGVSVYANGGLDLRLMSWFKFQFGLNFDTRHGVGYLLGAGLTW